MILRRIEVRNFRKLVGPVVIDLDVGLNVIFGNNEEGKSTLLQALRSAFFDRYNTSVATAYRPYGSESQPEVTVNFEVNGDSYCLNKKFCSPAKATLTWGSESLENARVDEKLKELLQFKAVNGQSQPRDHGLWGMLWLNQGEGFDGFAANPEGTGTIQQALGEEVGAMLGGEKGEAILKGATDDLQEFFTPTLRPNKTYEELLSNLKSRESELDQLKSELANFEQRQQQLESSSEELADLIAERTLDIANEHHLKASAAVAEIEKLRAQQTDADGKALRAEDAKSLAVQKADSRQALVENVQRLEQEIEKQNKRLKELAPALAKANTSISEASAGVLEWKQKQANIQQNLQHLQAAIPLNSRAVATLTSWAQIFPKRKPGHFVFPAESYGASGDTFVAHAYATDPSKSIGSVKEAWEGAKKRTRRQCPQCLTGLLANSVAPKQTASKKTKSKSARSKKTKLFVCTQCDFVTAELPDGVQCRFHDLKHTAVSRIRGAGVSIAKVAKIVGWSLSTMVLMAARYGHFPMNELRDAVETISRPPKAPGSPQ